MINFVQRRESTHVTCPEKMLRCIDTVCFVPQPRCNNSSGSIFAKNRVFEMAHLPSESGQGQDNENNNMYS